MNARHFIANGKLDWTLEEFVESGRENVRAEILTVRDAHRLLRPGALFKFQVSGCPGKPPPQDTRFGVPFSEREAQEMAVRCGFENRYRTGSGTQMFWLWFFKPEEE